MKILDNHLEIFENAIKQGLFSENEKDDIYVGNFMYMYSQDGKHYFKHKMTRLYGSDKESIKDTCEMC